MNELQPPSNPAFEPGTQELSAVETWRDGPVHSGEKIPPHDILAEQSVLGAMLLSKDAIADVTGMIRAADFYQPRHEIIFDTILELYTKGEPADVVTVANYLTTKGDLARAGGADYLHTLTQEVPTAANAEFYAEIVNTKAVIRRLINVATRIVKLGYSEQGDPTDMLNRAQADIYAVATQEVTQDYVPISEAVHAAVEQIANANKDPNLAMGVPTGFKALDDKTNGFKGGQMIVIAARPGMGKSTLALDVARAATIKAKIPTVFFSLEMGKEEIATRLLSAESSIFMDKLQRGQIDDRQAATLQQVQEYVSTAPLYIDDSPNMTLVEIRAKCRRLKQQAGLGAVIIDYLQLLSSGKKVESRQQEVSEFSRSLKLLAKELDVPVIALSQLNRAAEQRADKRPHMSDLRESGSIEQDADKIILLHRDPSAKQGDPGFGEAEFLLVKQRNGPTGDIRVAFQGQFSRFEDIPE